MDKNCAGKRRENECSCGKPDCKLTGSFGDTSMGNPEVWHGNVDIIVNDDVAITLFDEQPDSPSDKSPVEAKSKSTDLSRNEQIIAETVVFSFLQKQRRPEKAQFLSPCIGIGSSEMVIVFYDSKHDILLESSKIALLECSRGQEKISTLAVLVSWLVVNHRYLCTGLQEDMKAYKADFFSLAKGKLEVYTKQLHFGNVDSSFLMGKRPHENDPEQCDHLNEIHLAALTAIQERKQLKKFKKD